MWFGAHLPLTGIDGTGTVSLAQFVQTARGAGFTAISASDHLVFPQPWLDGLVALSSVVDASADLTLATTTTLPVLRGPAVVAKAAATLDALSGGRFILGVSPGNSTADYAAAGIPFAQRWPRFDESVRVLRASLTGTQQPDTRRFYDVPILEPLPARPIPIWIGSWGSSAGLRRVARLADGWLAAAANTSPDRIVLGRNILHEALAATDRSVNDLPVVLTAMWTFVTNSAEEARHRREALARILDRDPTDLAHQVLIGTPGHCAEILSSYAAAGVDGIFIWPVADPIDQLRRFGSSVVPLLD